LLSVKPECGGGLLLLRHVTPLSRRHVVYFCSGAHTQVDDQTVLRIGHVGDLDRRKFGPAESAGEANKKKCAITPTPQAFRTMRDDRRRTILGQPL
jgi:hypothetical protein